MSLESIGGAVGGWAWTNKAEILRQLRDFRAWWSGTGKPGRGSKPGIVILGAGGVGKSTLARILSGDADFLFDPPVDYEESVGVESVRVKGDPDVEIVVSPGQEHRRATTWAEIQADIAGGRYRGIVLISSYGYHSVGDLNYRVHHLFNGGKAGFLARYLEDRRAEEIRIIRELAPHIAIRNDRLWLLHLVTKQDLWWPHRAEVESHYRRGECGMALEELARRAASKSFRIETALCSLVISNFNAGGGERLKSNSAGYDQAALSRSVRRVVEIISALKDWEDGR